MAQTHFDEFDPETVDQGGMPKPGKCQLLVSAVEVHEEGDKPYVSVTHEIAAHEDPDQVGKTTYNSLSLTGKGARRALLFALATGVVTKQELAQAKAQGSTVDIDYEKAYGQVYFGTLEESEYNGKKKCRVEWDFRPLGDKEAVEYPCSPDYPRPAMEQEQVPEKKTAPPQKSAAKSAVKTQESRVQPPPTNDEIPF